MLKKTLLAAAVTLAVSGVSTGVAQGAPAFEPGTYKAEGTGIHGPVVVEVTFTKDRIEKIAVVSSTKPRGSGRSPSKPCPPRWSKCSPLRWMP